MSSLRVPVAYEATVRVQPSWRLGGTVVTLDKVDQYAATLGGRLKSSSNLNGVIAELKLPHAPATLASNPSVAADHTYNEQIDVTATDSNPVRASQIANAVVAAYVRQSHSLPDTIWVDASAVPPQSPARPHPQLEALIGGFVGILMAASLFYARRRLDVFHAQPPAQGGVLVRIMLPASARGRRLFSVVFLLVCGAAMHAGAAASGALSDPTLAFTAFIPLLLVAVLVSPASRLAVLAIGGLLVFQSSQNVTVAKVTYFAVAATISVISVVRVWDLQRSPAFARLSRLLYASVALALLLAVSFVVARSNGTGVVSWARDAAPYGLLILAVVLAVDVSASRPSRVVLELLLVGCGVAAALAYANDWLQRRDYGSLPVNLPVLQSFLLPAALFAYSTSQVLAGRRRVIWAAIAVAVGFLLFVTGSRASLLILVVPIVVAVWAGPLKPAPISRRVALALVPAASAAVLTAGFLFVSTAAPATPLGSGPLTGTVNKSPAPATSPVAQSSPVPNPPASPSTPLQYSSQVLQTRLIAERFEKILLITHDPSFVERVTVDGLAWDTFIHHPVLGVGPGYLYRWPTPGGQVKKSPYLDTGLSLLTKFGLAVLPVLVLLAMGLAHVVRDKGLPLATRAALLGYWGIAVVWMAVEAPLEDKGLGLGLAMLLALTLTNRVGQTDRPEESAAVDQPKPVAAVQSKVAFPA